MGALPAGDVCTCDHQPAGAIAISGDLLRELMELKELKQQMKDLQQLLMNQNSSPTDHFLLQTSYGNLIWTIVLCFLWAGIRNCCKIYRFIKTVCQIRLFRYRNDLQTTCMQAGGGGSAAPNVAGPLDINEGAMAIEAGLAEISSDIKNSNRSDIQQKEAEMSSRKSLRQLLSAAYKEVKKKIKGDDGKLPTYCTTETITSASIMADVGTSPLPIPLGVLLPESTLREERKEKLSRKTIHILKGSNTQNLSVETGSTFLSATVCIQPSGIYDLLHRATRLVKMGSRFDPSCTVQLGAGVILYTTAGKIVKTLLLEEGVYDVPIITSVQGFYRIE